MPRMRRLRHACLAALLLGLPAAAGAVTPPLISEAQGGQRGALVLQAGSGKVLTLSGAAANVFVADPKVAEVRPASATSLFVFGIGAGRTTVAALDSNGHVLAQYEITVQPSAFGAVEAQAAIARLIPSSHVQVQPLEKGLLLTGSVTDPEDAAQAVVIAKGFAGNNPNIDNELTITAPIQVTLSVRVAQMSRQVVRKLGINWSTLGNIGRIGRFQPALSLSASTGATAVAASCPTCLGAGFLGVIDALANDNLAQVLAEPNLTVMSGQTGSFQVGGEYPIPVSGQNGQINVAYKNFGVMLSFVPTVLGDGRINLHVRPEVSELSNQNGVQVATGGVSLIVPALNVRRAETTVELGSGQSFAIAGLLQQTTTDSGSGVPFAGDLPLLGALFHDNQFQRTETELVIVVTPYIVRPVNNPADLHLPTEGYKPPSDIQRLLLMRQVSENKPPVPVRIPGDAGFIVQ
jgi:pilus assembly protein CpaC